MKKLPLMLAVVFAIGLTSCGGEEKKDDKKDGNQTEQKDDKK